MSNSDNSLHVLTIVRLATYRSVRPISSSYTCIHLRETRMRENTASPNISLTWQKSPLGQCQSVSSKAQASPQTFIARDHRTRSSMDKPLTTSQMRNLLPCLTHLLTISDIFTSVSGVLTTDSPMYPCQSTYLTGVHKLQPQLMTRVEMKEEA